MAKKLDVGIVQYPERAEKLKKAMNWMLRSDIITFSLFALASLVETYSKGEIEFRFMLIAILVLFIRTSANLIDYWRNGANND